jgi:hypothetical protein
MNTRRAVCEQNWVGGEFLGGEFPSYLGYHGYLGNPRVENPQPAQ